MIVSIHIPKTAGTSFREGIEQEFGQRLLTDYGDRPLSDSIPSRWRRLYARLVVRRRRDTLRRDYDVVHGHFIASKYSSLTPDAAFCAFFRDPVNRVHSQYKYWLSNPDPQNRMWRKFHAEGLSLARFASLPRQRRIYRLFTSGWPMERFTFVGITEEYKLTLDLFNAVFGVRIPCLRSNIGGRKSWMARNGGLLKRPNETTIVSITRLDGGSMSFAGCTCSHPLLNEAEWKSTRPRSELSARPCSGGSDGAQALPRQLSRGRPRRGRDAARPGGGAD